MTHPLLLQPQDPSPVSVLNGDGDAPLLLVGDHANNHIPSRLDALGLTEMVLQQHVAYDIGTRKLLQQMSQTLDAQAVIATYSRLVVDLNRHLEDPSAIPLVSDHIPVPGNQAMDEKQKQQRIDEIYTPYRDMIETRLQNFFSRKTVPAFVAIHSFTPVMDNIQRPWHIGILWDKDPRIAVPMMRMLRDHPDQLVVGDNQPYSGKHPADYTIDHHAERLGIPHVSIEIRQDLLSDEAGISYWNKILTDILREILADGSIHSVMDYSLPR